MRSRNIIGGKHDVFRLVWGGCESRIPVSILARTLDNLFDHCHPLLTVLRSNMKSVQRSLLLQNQDRSIQTVIRSIVNTDNTWNLLTRFKPLWIGRRGTLNILESSFPNCINFFLCAVCAMRAVSFTWFHCSSRIFEPIHEVMIVKIFW